MMSYLVQLRYRMFVKGYGFLSFAKNMGKNIRSIENEAIRTSSEQVRIFLRRDFKLKNCNFLLL